MRQCLSCNATFDDSMVACGACGGQRSFLIAGSPPSQSGGGGGGGGGGVAQALSGILSPDFTPNGVVWCGLGMMAVEIPNLVVLMSAPSTDPNHFILAVLTFLNLLLGIPVLMQQEWSYWFARVVMIVEILRHLRIFFISAAFSGLNAFAIGGLFSAIALVICQVLLQQGYAHSSSRLWVRTLVPVLLVNLVMVVFMFGAAPVGPSEDQRDTDDKALATLKDMNMGMAPGDKLRVVDNLLCVSWCPPGDWVIDRVSYGAHAHPEEGDDEMEITLMVAWNKSDSDDPADDPLSPIHGISTTSFATTSGIQGRLSSATAGGKRYLTAMIPGKGKAYYIFTACSDATRPDHTKQFTNVAASIRLEDGEPDPNKRSQNNSPFDLIPNMK